ASAALASGWLGGAARLVRLARFAPLVGAGMLAATSPAAAQAEPAPSEESPAAPQDPAAPPASEPSAPVDPAAPAPPVGDVSPPPADDLGEAVIEGEPLPEDPPEVYEGDLAEVVVTGFRVSLTAALQKKQRATG